MPVIRLLARLLAIVVCLSITSVASAQTRVENIASLTFRDVASDVTVRSNAVVLDVARTKRPTTLGFRLPPPGYRLTGLGCQTTPTLIGLAAPIDAATLDQAPPLAALDPSQPLVMVLTAPGENHDPATREYAYIGADTPGHHQQLRLLETAPDSGVFAGGVPSLTDGVVVDPCSIALGRGDRLTLGFTENDDSYASTVSRLVDPAGYVYDSATGALVSGARVTLLDGNDQPAMVYGDDGISVYPASVVSGDAVTDASGRVYPAAAGFYRFPLIPPGQYRLRIEPPTGYTAPSQADPARLATLKDPNGGSFVVNAASFGRPFAVTGEFVSDVPIDPVGGPSLLLTKTSSVREASPGDFVQYRLSLVNRGGGAATASRVADTLPPGLRYESGSTRGGGEPIVSSDGRRLTFTMPPLAAGASAEVRYVVIVTPGAPVGEAVNRARATDGATSNEAAAAVRLRPLLFTDAMTIVGRVSEGACGDPATHRKGIAGIRLLLEDGTFVATDVDGLYHVEGVRAGRHVVQIDTATIPASYQAVACDRDTRQAHSAISRFVEGAGGMIRRVDFQLRAAGRAAAASDVSPAGEVDDAMAAGNRDWLAAVTTAPAAPRWLFPAADHNPRAPVQRVVVAHAPDQHVALTVNGIAADPLAFDGTDQDAARGVAVSTWTGLPLAPGDNRFVARVLDGDGKVAAVIDRIVHYAGVPAHAVIDPAHSRLVADGRTGPLIAIRVTDAAGRPVRQGSIVPFAVDQPYAAAIDADVQPIRPHIGTNTATARVVGDDGIALITLQPTTHAGAVRAVVSMAEDNRVRTNEVRAWLSAGQRDWVVVGFGAGTVGYDRIARHRVALPRAARDRVVRDGQLAFYAKGRIKGSWLLTIAYDSDRRYDADRGLLGTIDPDRYYTVYGDGSAQGYDAATRRKLYLRLERRQAYALFGDFETGFVDTRLARYSRTLNGAQAAYDGARVRATGFVAKADTQYARDEIRGNGLSGPYRLTTRGIVPNSDKVRIEVRDRVRSERIISSTPMARHLDYDIDVDRGTIRFRAPVLTRDAAFNPIYIVADYEVEAGRGGKLAAAGRVVAKLGRVAIGASGIRDETAGKATIAAADVRARLGATELRGEIATGGQGGIGQAIAFLAEVEHHGNGVDVLAYARQQDAGFGVGQQNLVEAGTRKYGVDGRIALTDRLSITGIGWYQDMIATGASRIAGEARAEWRRAGGTLFAGGQIAADRGSDHTRDSRLLTLGGTQTLFDGRLTLAGQTQFAPGGDKTATDFPVRHQLTAAWTVRPGIRLIGGYEIADGGDGVGHNARVGFDVAPWTGARLTSTLNQQVVDDTGADGLVGTGFGGGENGARTYAQYGLSQSLPLGRHWSVDATLDAASTIRGNAPRGATDAFRPVTGGEAGIAQVQVGGDYAAVTLGAAYRTRHWSWNGRIEYRGSDTGNRWGLISNILRTLDGGRTVAAGFRGYRVTDTGGNAATQAVADVAIAFRPPDSAWSVLERLELRHEGAAAGFDDRNILGIPAYGGGAQVTTRLVNNIAVNYRSGAEGNGHGLDASVYYGAKYVKGRFADDVYTGFVDVTGFELRRDLGTRFDIGIAGSVQHGWARGLWARSGGPSLGISPAADTWITAGYNIAGYRDRDFADDRYTRQGPYVTMRLKFDQLSLRWGRAG